MRLIRDREKGGKGVWRWGKWEIIYLLLHCYHQNDSCIKMGSDVSHFNVSLIVRDKVTRQCPQTTILEEKRRAEADSNWGPSAYQPNALLLGQTSSLLSMNTVFYLWSVGTMCWADKMNMMYTHTRHICHRLSIFFLKTKLKVGCCVSHLTHSWSQNPLLKSKPPLQPHPEVDPTVKWATVWGQRSWCCCCRLPQQSTLGVVTHRVRGLCTKSFFLSCFATVRGKQSSWAIQTAL